MVHSTFLPSPPRHALYLYMFSFIPRRCIFYFTFMFMATQPRGDFGPKIPRNLWATVPSKKRIES